jgi:hypothetical protein
MDKVQLSDFKSSLITSSQIEKLKKLVKETFKKLQEKYEIEVIHEEDNLKNLHEEIVEYQYEELAKGNYITFRVEEDLGVSLSHEKGLPRDMFKEIQTLKLKMAKIVGKQPVDAHSRGEIVYEFGDIEI